MGNLLYESEWGFKSLNPTDLTGENAIHIFPSQPNSDDLQYSVGSASLNSGANGENINTSQSTWEAWIRPNWDGDVSEQHYVIALKLDSSSFIELVKHSGAIFRAHYAQGGFKSIATGSTAGWSAGEWHHVALVYDVDNAVPDSTKRLRLYLDGVANDGNDSADWTAITPPSTFVIGQDDVGGRQFNGTLKYHIRNRPLTAAEVTALYNSGDGHLDSFVVGPDTVALDNFSDSDTGIHYHHTGKGVSTATSGGVITTDAGSDTSFEDTDGVNLEDATGFSASGPVLVEGAPSDTSVSVGSGIAFADLDGDSQYFYRTDADFPESGITGANDLTIYTWIKPGILTGNQNILSKYLSTGDKRMFYLRQVSADLIFYVNSDGTGPNGTSKLTTTAGLIVGEWVFAAAVYDASAGTVDIYKNGTFLEQGTGLKTSIADKDPDFTISGEANAANLFNGSIGPCALFDDKRTAAEIYADSRDFDVDLSGEGNIIGQWMFSEAAGATAIDNTQGDAGRDLIPFDGGDVTFSTLRSTTGGYVQDVERVGVSLDFDGSESVAIVSTVTTDIDNISMVAEVVWDGAMGANQRIIQNGTASDEGYALALQFLDSNQIAVLVNGVGWRNSNSNLPVGKAVHIVGVRDAGSWEVYVNGEAISTGVSDPVPNAITGASETRIGARSGTEYFNGQIYSAMLIEKALTAADILYLAANPGVDESAIVANTTVNAGEMVLHHDYRNQNLIDVSSDGAGALNGNDGTHSGTASFVQDAHLSRNLLLDIEHGGIGGYTIVGTPTLVDKESDTDSDSLSLHIVAAADDDGVSQTIPASNGDKFYLHQRHKVSNGSFEVNVTNGGGGIETGIADAGWTLLEKIISATGNLTFQWLGEAAGDDWNVSKATIIKCVLGNVLDATTYYTLVSVDGGAVGVAWSGLGADAPETDAADLYIRDDTRAASTATKGSGFISLINPLYVG